MMPSIPNIALNACICTGEADSPICGPLVLFWLKLLVLPEKDETPRKVLALTGMKDILKRLVIYSSEAMLKTR
jgi:hypothetical protein